MSWSPPGLARFRRSVLAVLTSNLVLSFWEPIGSKRQWTRVGIVNHVFHQDPSAPMKVGGEKLRRVNIRSFQWCAPLKVPTPTNDPNPFPEPQSRWGIHMLAVATDLNDLALLRVRRSAGMQARSSPYCVEQVALHPLNQEEIQFPMACPGSLLHGRVQSQARVSSISCGPWIATPSSRKDDDHSATAIFAAAYGTRLRFFKASVAVRYSSGEEKGVPRYEATAELGEHPVTQFAPRWNHHRITGPVEWLYTVRQHTLMEHDLLRVVGHRIRVRTLLLQLVSLEVSSRSQCSALHTTLLVQMKPKSKLGFGHSPSRSQR